jgi:cytosine/creatinine deaminase
MRAESPRRLQLQLPRALLDPLQRDLPCGDADGLVPVQLDLEHGRIAAIRPLPPARGLPLAITPPVDAHAHLDKAFSWAGHPNRGGGMAAALEVNLKEGQQRSEEQVRQRCERALDQAWRYGLRAIRSHVDSGGPAAEPSWEALLELQQQWRGRVDLQLVALVPLDHWSSPEGQALARRVAAAGGVLGGVLGPPYPRGRRDPQVLQALLRLAAELGCGVDLHVDESGEAPGRGVRLLLDQLDRVRSEVLITCSHASSMGLLPLAAQQRLADRLAQQQVGVVALPTTNFWLLGRRGDQDLAQRPLAPVRQLQRAGVAVAVGGDNVQDPWDPGGDFDPLELLRLASRVAHCPPWQRQGLAPFTTVPARMLALDWDGILRRGAPADLLITSAGNWSELLARPPQRRVLRAGQWLPAAITEQPAPSLASLGLPAAP